MRPALLLPVLLLACVKVDYTDTDDVDTDFAPDTDPEEDAQGPGFPVVPAGEDDWPWNLPDGFPRPLIPAENPMTEDKVALGRWLFHDGRLAVDGQTSCAACHPRDTAFADPRARSVGATGSDTTRNAPGLQNVAYMTSFNWANPSVETLALQHAGPLFGTSPVEMGANEESAAVLDTLRADSRYATLFPAAFPDADDPFDWENVRFAIASFVRSMVSADAPVDRFVYGDDPEALTEPQVRGLDLFFSERFECHHCHGGFQWSRAVAWQGGSTFEQAFDNIGLYNVANGGAYPERDRGLRSATGEAADDGRFRPPSLRNVARTAPYMHDGSIATLGEVVDHYAAGGRNLTSGPDAGDGRLHPEKSSFLHGFSLTPQERADLLAFLEALTDASFLADPAFADPFQTASDTADTDG